jgi:hypothetical protein
MSGAAAMRLSPHMPIARSAPVLMCCCTLGSATTPKSICPPSRSVTIGPTPLYGMCLADTLATSRNISAARCRMVPVPPEPKLKPSGRAFSAAMKSRLLVAVTFCGFTTSTIGVLPITAIGVKSPGMLNGRLFMTLGKITTLLDTTDKVKPSGGFFVSACRPITPLAPAWFSTTTAWPSDLASAGAAERVMASTPEPVAFGRMNLTVRSDWARAGWTQGMRAWRWRRDPGQGLAAGQAG